MELSVKGKPKLKLYKASEIEPEEIRWLWYPYVPAGKLVMLEGDPGLGKSWISCKLAADLSTGRALPGQKPLPPMNVLMLSAEDGLADTLVPRLRLLEADLERITISDTALMFDTLGLREIEDVMRQNAVSIAFVDPIVAYMGGKVDMNKANEVRAIMQPLSDAAKHTNSSIIAVRHLRKAGGTNSKYRGIGSIDFTAAVRSVIQVGETKQGKTFLEHVKHNLSPKGDTLMYEIDPDVGFRWTGSFSPTTLSSGAPKLATMTSALRAQIEQFLFDLLRDGAVATGEIMKAAGEQGFKTTMLNTVKRDMNIASFKKGAVWYWSLSEREGFDDATAGAKGSGDVREKVPPETSEKSEFARITQLVRERLPSST